MLQKAMLAMTGPTALARAPSDRNMPKTVPFCCAYPYIDAIVVMHDTTIAVARQKKRIILYKDFLPVLNIKLYIGFKYKFSGRPTFILRLGLLMVSVI